VEGCGAVVLAGRCAPRTGAGPGLEAEVSPGEFVEADRFFEAREERRAEGVHGQAMVAGGAEGFIGEEDLAAVCVAGHPSSKVDRYAEHVAIGFEDITVVDGAADFDGAGGWVEFLDAPLGGDRVSDRAIDRIEGEKEAIAEGADQASAAHGRGILESGGEILEHAVGFEVAQLPRDPQRAGDIDEEESPARDRCIEVRGSGGEGEVGAGQGCCISGVRVVLATTFAATTKD
jgi:hypothetical protein